MPKLSTRERILLGVLAAGSIGLWLGLPRDPGNFGGANGDPDAEARQLGEPPLIRVDLLALRTSGFDPNARNLFTYYEPQIPLPAPQRPETPPAPTNDRRPLPHPPPLLPTNPSRPEPAFAYIGFFGPREAKIAVFDTGTEVLVAEIGDMVGDGFKLLEFRYEAVVLGYIGGKYKGETATLKKRSS